LISDLSELELVKKNINEGKEPWAGEFLKLKNSAEASPNYLSKMKPPPAIISSGLSGAHAVGAFEEMRDANAAYAQALMWYFTGDKTFANNGEAILEAYANSVSAHEGPNWYLLIAWAGAVFPISADILHATDPDWKNDRLIAKWFNNVFLPPLHDRISAGNRELAVINAMGAIGVYNEDPAAIYEAMNHWVNFLPDYYCLSEDGAIPPLVNYWTPENTPSDEFLMSLDNPTFPKDWTSWVVLSQENFSVDKRRGKMGDDSTFMRKSVQDNNPVMMWPAGTFVNGFSGENGRDLNHVDVAFASTINLAEIAWHQGIDVYTPAAKRLTTFMEVMAGLRLGEDPPSSIPAPLKAMGMGPVYEIAFDHYHNLMGIELPKTFKLLETASRPAGGATVYPLVRGAAGHDPEHPRLWKYPPPYPPLFASSINGENGWVSSWQSLTHRNLHAH
jgi:hypothetical protein